MFGLEKKKYKPFEFDLEKELKKDPKKIEDTRKIANSKIQKIKELLRSGEKSNDLGVLLHGYTALNKVLDKVEETRGK
jgi:hypothetical protein